jgi:hypothetical protein
LLFNLASLRFSYFNFVKRDVNASVRYEIKMYWITHGWSRVSVVGGSVYLGLINNRSSATSESFYRFERVGEKYPDEQA